MGERYEILIEGHISPAWSDWLAGMQITLLENGNTLLSGELPDQAALHGLLNQIRDMNLKLERVEKQKDSKGFEAP